MRFTRFMLTCLLVMSFFSSCLGDMLTRFLYIQITLYNRISWIYIFKIILI